MTRRYDRAFVERVREALRHPGPKLPKSHDMRLKGNFVRSSLRRRSVPATSAADGMAGRAQQEENQAHEEQDDPERVEDRDRGHVADDDEDETQDDHGALLPSFRLAHR